MEKDQDCVVATRGLNLRTALLHSLRQRFRSEQNQCFDRREYQKERKKEKIEVRRR